MYSNQVWAALALDSTRYIYKGDSQSLPLTVKNDAKMEFGAQVWVENIIENDTRPTFITTPPFFIIKGEGEQLIRIMKVSDHMPKDKESIYWFNLQEIPPKQKGSGIALAIRTRVKLLYRPEGLEAGRKGAEKNLTVEYLPGEQWLVNTTPYIFAVQSVLDVNDQPLEFNHEDSQTLAMFMPGDRVRISNMSVKAVSALNDYGNVEINRLISAK